jgi:Zn-dependent peptidase ImmA (M78 family)/DNA-binding XRE family transcriptional regulator
MTNTAAWVAGAIRSAREQRGWSQSELARRLKRTQTAVSYWEAGKRAPGLDDLVDLATVLDVTVEIFFPPDRVRRPVITVLRATAERLADSELQTAINDLLNRAELAELPETRIEITGNTATHAANELLEKARITKPPVDIERLAELCGVLVLYSEFPDSLSGLVFAHDGAAVIGVNQQHPVNRKRFSLGHELGHYLLGHHQESRGYEDRFHIDAAEGTAPGYDWRAERTANDFAAEILMARKLISQAFKKTQDPEVLAEMFEVSELAMGYRLVNLGLR